MLHLKTNISPFVSNTTKNMYWYVYVVVKLEVHVQLVTVYLWGRRQTKATPTLVHLAICIYTYQAHYY